MALILDPILAAAQDSLERQPIVELISTQIADAIPFDGQYFNDGSDKERDSSLIIGSTGQMFSVAVREVSVDDYDKIIFLYTDIERTYWTEAISITAINTVRTFTNVCLVELANGNLSIVYVEKSGTTYYLKYGVIDTEGNLASTQTIATYSGGTVISDPYVIRLANGTYYFIYVKFDGIYYSIQKRTSTDFSTWSSESLLLLDLS